MLKTLCLTIFVLLASSINQHSYLIKAAETKEVSLETNLLILMPDEYPSEISWLKKGSGDVGMFAMGCSLSHEIQQQKYKGIFNSIFLSQQSQEVSLPEKSIQTLMNKLAKTEWKHVQDFPSPLSESPHGPIEYQISFTNKQGQKLTFSADFTVDENPIWHALSTLAHYEARYIGINPELSHEVRILFFQLQTQAMK